MKTTTYLAIRRPLILIILLFISVLVNAQIQIKSRVDIAPRASVNASVQSYDLAPSYSITMPFSGPGVLWITWFDYISEGQARLTMNGQTIVEDIWDQVYLLENTRIDLGYHEQGEVLIFKLIDPSSGNIFMDAQECNNFDNVCAVSRSVLFTNVPICGQDTEFSGEYPQNVNVDIGFANAAEQAKTILQPAWEGSILFKDPTLLRADCESACGGSVNLPAGTTFTFTITQGKEHAILYDIYSGNEGTSLSGIPADVSDGWVRLKAIGDEPSQPVNVIIEAKIPGANTCIFHITILPNDLKIIPTKSVITYGDTLRFDVWKKLSDTTYGSLESGMEYYYSLVEGDDAGYLTSPDGSQTDNHGIGGDFSSSIFTAFGNISQGKSTLVKLKAMAWVPPPPCTDCQPSNINIKPLPVTNGRKINKTDSTPIEKNAGTGPTGVKNNTGTLKMPIGIEKPQPTSLHKNADGSYSFVNRDSTGARLSSKNFEKIIKQQADNSSQTVLRKNAYGGYSPEKINPITSKTGSSIAGTQDEVIAGRLYGIVTIEVVKPSDILLGQTKYYTAKPDPDQYSNLIITESFSPDLGDGDERVIFEDPVIADDAINNDKIIGVYWDYYLDKDGKDLDNGVIRLVGRYWKQDTTYKVKLHAVLKELGREGAVEIEVKKPLKLGDAYDNSKDVHGQPLSIDEKCIEYGGKYGIPPQFIKAQIFNEASKNLDGVIGKGFAPTYVYEPYTAQNWSAWKKDSRYNKGMWLVNPLNPDPNQQMGTGKPVPTHQNVQDFSYPTTPQTVWDMIVEHSQLVNTSSGFDHTKYGKRNSDGTMDFYGKMYPSIDATYQMLLRVATYNFHMPFAINTISENARAMMTNYLQYMWQGVGAEKIPAQTRVASSYGFLQFLFSTAVEERDYPNYNPNISPEDLNETDINLYYGMEYQKKLLKNNLGIEKEASGNWQDGFEGTFKKYVWGKWNTRRLYPSEVANKIKDFVPQ